MQVAQTQPTRSTPWVILTIPSREENFRTLKNYPPVPAGAIVVIDGATDLPYRYGQLLADLIDQSAAGAVGVRVARDSHLFHVLWSRSPAFFPGQSLDLPADLN